MNARRRPRGLGCLITLLIIILLLALICAAPFVYHKYFAKYDYDDVAALAAENAEPVDISADGERLIFRMDKADIYTQLLASGALDSLGEDLGAKVSVEQLGYTLHTRGDGYDAGVEVCAAVRLFGIVPAQVRALGDVYVEDARTLRVELREVEYGPFISVSAEKLAGWTGMDELTEGFYISLDEWAEPLRAEKVRLDGDGLCFSSALLALVIDEVAEQDAPRDLRLLRLYFGSDELPSAFFADGRKQFIRAAGASLGALRTALRDVVTFASDEYRCALIDELSVLPFDLNSELKKLSLSQLWDAERTRILETQAYYHEVQTELRTEYWHKEVTLSKPCLLGADGAPLEDQLPAEWEARIVLQYNEGYNAIVKTNEGNPRLNDPIPGLPLMSELPRDSRDALPPEGDGPFDLSIALRLPSGTPAVIFLTAEDDFGLAVISEQLFKEIKEKDRLPIYSSRVIASAPREQWLRLYLGEDQLNANYINVP